MERRQFLQTVGRAGAGAAFHSAWGQRPRLYDILIKGGEAIDPSRGFRSIADVAVLDGKIDAIEANIPAERAADVVDAKGLYVTPGLVDLHTHIHYGLGIGIEADPVAARSGTTTWVDAGTFSQGELFGFRRFIVEPARARIYGYVYLYPNDRNPDEDPVKYVNGMMDRTGKMAVANRDIILGVKLQVGSNMNGRYSLEFLKIARRLCDKYELPLMVHVSMSPPSTDEVMALMRAGDVITHCFNGHTLGIVDDKGKIKASVLDARARGVLFDVGHGLGSFNFEVARKALDQGFLPDSISTDIYTLNINGPVYDMPTTMSKLLLLGMSFEDVLKRSTINPARVINRMEGMGTLAVGSPADIALLELAKGQFQLVDSQRNGRTAKEKLVSRLTICRGKRLIA
jgi:dihydroorotase